MYMYSLWINTYDNKQIRNRLIGTSGEPVICTIVCIEHQERHRIKMENEDKKHKRRKRYKGTHPKTYQEKYKELQPEKYPETIAKVISKGSTPVGMHLSICVKEILDFFQIQPGQIGLDVTLGYGGHTQEMLKCLEGQGHLYALDVDSIEILKTKERLENLGYGEDILTICQLNFANIDQIAAQSGPFDFILADLGVSSMQIDNPDRGFTFKKDGPLDLRLDPEKGISAAERLKNMSQEELQGMFIENSDEPYAEIISKAIVSHIKKGHNITTTAQLRQIIEHSLSFLSADKRKEESKKSCQRCFQALRIDVNNEFEVLYEFLEKLPNALSKGGRVAILTFHSGEDRIVKKSFKQRYKEGIYEEIATEVIRPSAEECSINSRARSTKMRWAIKA